MKLYVLKNPSPYTIATCEEVPDDAPIPAAPWELMTVADYEAWKATQPTPAAPAPLLRQDTLIVRRRLTDAEKQALHNAQQSDWRVADFIGQADSAGVIDQSDPNYSSAVSYLASLNVIAADRWPVLLAP